MDEPKHIVQKTGIEKKPTGVKKNWWIAVSLVGIFLLVLFLNSYFNITSETSINPEGKDFDKFYLSGPDPYYNMRLVDETLYGEKAGYYPYYSDIDPLLAVRTQLGNQRQIWADHDRVEQKEQL